MPLRTNALPGGKHPRPIATTSVLPPPGPGGLTFGGAAPAGQNMPASAAGSPGRPGEGDRKPNPMPPAAVPASPMPTPASHPPGGRPVLLPGTPLSHVRAGVREGIPGSIRLTGAQEGSAQLPPWEVAAQNSSKAPAKWVPSAPAPKPAPVVPPEPEKPLEILTPDLPAPPVERANAAPVGDETVIELVEDDAPGDSLELELENTNHGYDEEIPLEVRKTRRAALPRIQLGSHCAPPPVEDVGEALPTRYYILAEDGTEPPTKDEEEVGHEVIVIASVPPRKEGAARSRSEAPPLVETTPGGQNRMVGMLVVLLLALGLAGYFLLSRGSGSAQAPTPSTDQGANTSGVAVVTPNPTPVVPVAVTPVTVTPVTAPEPPPPVPATPAPAPVTPPPVVITPVPPPPPTVVPVRLPAPVAPKAVESPKPTPTPKPATPVKSAEPVVPPTPKPVSAPAPAEKPVAAAPAPDASPVRVIVVSNQIGAEVQVNGTPRGRVPATVMLPPGSYQIKVIPKELPEQSRSVEVKSDGAATAQKVVFTF
ncbi:MAG: PEGA domain-containing protein [Myxococcota bacterium]